MLNLVTESVESSPELQIGQRVRLTIDGKARVGVIDGAPKENSYPVKVPRKGVQWFRRDQLRPLEESQSKVQAQEGLIVPCGSSSLVKWRYSPGSNADSLQIITDDRVLTFSLPLGEVQGKVDDYVSLLLGEHAWDCAHFRSILLEDGTLVKWEYKSPFQVGSTRKVEPVLTLIGEIDKDGQKVQSISKKLYKKGPLLPFVFDFAGMCRQAFLIVPLEVVPVSQKELQQQKDEQQALLTEAWGHSEEFEESNLLSNNWQIGDRFKFDDRIWQIAEILDDGVLATEGDRFHWNHLMGCEPLRSEAASQAHELVPEVVAPLVKGRFDQIPIDQIKLDGGTQSRAGFSQETLANYAEQWQSGAQFPPVTLFFDGTNYWLGDGFHRVQSAKLAGLIAIASEIRQGSKRDAVLYSVGANATHGLPRSNADKRRAVEALLRDEEWMRWSDSEIARRCAVSQPLVGKVRAELKSDPSYNDYRMAEERVVVRGKTTYTQQMGENGKKGKRADANAETARQGQLLGLKGSGSQQLPCTQQNDAEPEPETSPSPWTVAASFTFNLSDSTPIVAAYLPGGGEQLSTLALAGEITKNPNGTLTKIVSDADRDGSTPLECAKMLAELARRSYLAEMGAGAESVVAEPDKHFVDYHMAWVGSLEEMPDELLLAALEEVAKRAIKGRNHETVRQIIRAASKIKDEAQAVYANFLVGGIGSS